MKSIALALALVAVVGIGLALVWPTSSPPAEPPPPGFHEPDGGFRPKFDLPTDRRMKIPPPGPP